MPLHVGDVVSDREIALLYAALRSIRRVAETVRWSRYRVRQALRRAGAEVQPPYPPDHYRLRALDWPALYREHGSYRKVARAVGCSAVTAMNHLLAAGVVMGGPPRARWDRGASQKVAAYAARVGPAQAARDLDATPHLIRHARARAAGRWPGRQSQRQPRGPGVMSRQATRLRARRRQSLAPVSAAGVIEAERRRAERADWQGALT